MKRLKRLVALLLCALLLCGASAAALADGPRPYLLTIRVGERQAEVRAFSVSYAGNLYLNLGDTALALRGTEKQFSVEYRYTAGDGEHWWITTGQEAPDPDDSPRDATAVPYAVDVLLGRNRVFVDGGERRYYTFRPGGQELYMGLADLQLMLDLTISPDGAGSILIEPDRPFAPDLYALLEEDYFGAFNAVLLGDADTGEILFSYNRSWRYPIASLSKLMSFLLLEEALSAGEIGWQDRVTISAKAAAISWSADGVIGMSSGAEVSVEELMLAMMLASSNESALALAEHLCGSEEAFVERMNARASQLGLLSARFYTPHGLPSYSTSGLPGKRQNSMSAADLFRLCSLLLRNFPQMTEMTEKQFVRLEELSFTTANSNPLVFNMPGVDGMKTGSTNRAGYCLAASLPVESGGDTHHVVAIVLGAESAELRGQGTEILLRYAQRYYQEHGFGTTG